MKHLPLFVLLNLVLSCAEAAADQPPNIVFILVDDLGWSDLGCYGHPYHETPNVDRLARQGMRFTNGYSPAPICSAARASILTGKAVPGLRFEFVTKNTPGHQQLDAKVPLATPPFTLNLPLSEKTIAERLDALGYQTAFFGKWHVSQHYQKRYLAWHPQFGPQRQGFAVAVEDFGDHPYAWRKQAAPNAPDGVIPEDSMIRRVADFVRAPHQRPFFVLASLFYVHTPIENRCRWLVRQYEDDIPADSPQRQNRLEYAAFVHTMDHHVGKILDAVESSGRRDNTLVVLMSDNGGHPEYCSNAPLRGSKWNLYEGGIRVPFMARWPGRIEPASTCDAPVIGYDLLPTFVELAGGEASHIDGINIAGLLRNDGVSQSTRLRDRTLIWHFPFYHPESTFSKAIDSIGVADFAVSKTRPQSALRCGNYKLVKFAEDDRVELYDLSKDISEQHDLSGETPQVAKELDELLEKSLTASNARRATPKVNE